MHTAGCLFNLGVTVCVIETTLEHQFKSGYHEVGFPRGAHEYKTDWKPVAREYLKINIIPRIKNWIKKIICSRNKEGQ